MAASVALVVALLLGGGRWALVHNSTSPAACPGKAGPLTVTADPAVAPAISAIADRFNRDHRCSRVTVAARDSAETADGFAAGTVPQAWIPDSSLWLDAVRDDGQGERLSPGATSVATSPLVFVVPARLPRRAESVLERRSWYALRSGNLFALRILDPAGSATGMESLLIVKRISGNGPAAAGTFTTILRNAAATDGAADLGGQTPTPLLIASEQSAWQRLRATGNAVRTIYPANATVDLDFPFVTTTTVTGGLRRLATEFLAAIRSAAGAPDVQRAGLRTAGRKAGPELTAADLRAAAPRAVRLEVPGSARAMQQAWRRLHPATRTQP